MAGTPSEFEEKEFEAPLYNQLEAGTRLVWSPGQVFEEYIGIDRALFLSDPLLWRSFGRSAPLRGAFLHRYDWEFIWRHRQRRPLPTFALNLFIQAKRSHFHRRHPKAIRGRMPGKSCWRFDLESHQQEALGRVASKSGNRAIVCYAAPAFHRFTQLNAHTIRGTVVSASTFPLVEKLVGHRAFYYCGPGGSGVANPSPEDIEGGGIEDLIQDAGTELSSVNETPTSQLAGLASDIEGVVEGLPEENPRKASFFLMRSSVLEGLSDYPDVGESARAFVRVSVFASVFNLDWYVVTRAR
jgi:hypothetical protein